ncbi:MAG: hypothetical protein WD552_00970, partial [Candidatus Paceibacterota bacterium]
LPILLVFGGLMGLAVERVPKQEAVDSREPEGIQKVETSQASELFIGASSQDITPPLPVALGGQFHLRVAETIESPVTANVIVLERRDVNGTEETSVWVSADLVIIPEELTYMVREKVREKLPELDSQKIIINATHTHTAPVVGVFDYHIPEGVTTLEETLEFITDQILKGIEEAWDSRVAGSVSWGLGHAKVAYNRRAVYYDGSARMYGRTDLPEFRGLEGYEDNDVQALFFWNDRDQLLATTVNVSGPSQQVAGRSAVNADYWHPVRERLQRRFGRDLVVLGWTGAAGDQSPRPMYGNAGEERMIRLRNLDRLEELGRRIAVAVEDIYEVVEADRYRDVELVHEVKTLELPRRVVDLKSLNEAKNIVEEIQSDPEARIARHAAMRWQQDVIDRYERQQEAPYETLDIEVHLLRLGEIAIATNPFELYTEYGVRMKARSPALQTFVVQLVGPPHTYLPTMKAIRGGHYSAIIPSNEVGPEAGDVLVE